MVETFPFIKTHPRTTGFVAGTFGTLVFGLFITVAVYGEPLGGHSFDDDQDIVYPNF